MLRCVYSEYFTSFNQKLQLLHKRTNYFIITKRFFYVYAGNTSIDKR